jgi:hypothetical protein
MAILPFIRQFAFVDKAWFDQSAYPLIQKWLADFLESALFHSIMDNYPAWEEENIDTLYFPQH